MMMIVIIVIMGELRLSNRYSLGKGDDLYSLKWYKDEVEFYRLVSIIISNYHQLSSIEKTLNNQESKIFNASWICTTKNAFAFLILFQRL